MDNSDTLGTLIKFSLAIIVIPLGVLFTGAVALPGECCVAWLQWVVNKQPDLPDTRL
jgi:hypothetical protein